MLRQDRPATVLLIEFGGKFFKKNTELERRKQKKIKNYSALFKKNRWLSLIKSNDFRDWLSTYYPNLDTTGHILETSIEIDPVLDLAIEDWLQLISETLNNIQE